MAALQTLLWRFEKFRRAQQVRGARAEQNSTKPAALEVAMAAGVASSGGPPALLGNHGFWGLGPFGLCGPRDEPTL